ncbi:617_t:CDS:2 [Paraglomus brasilianum]|uniref:glutamate-5-semialdehyde dehydrogenase n=1 Tax=Paraglomus brasilianum TaxID=144538 RepID=A0A9N9CPE7_9GLOM|nr:617_t:CDS:2 [Paraglomus brasilianum]
MSEDYIENLVKNARKAANVLQHMKPEDKTICLPILRDKLQSDKSNILLANRQDKENAEKLVQSGNLSPSLFKRLDLEDGDKFDSMLQGITDIDNLPDPTGKITYACRLDEGLELYRVTCPVGVLLVIFEARPEVAVNITALALKSGNAAILKGGTECRLSLAALYSSIRSALAETNIPPTAIQLVETREEISALLSKDKYIDLVIPRGSNSLVKHIQGNTRIPVLGHADGLCSVYVDKDADLQKAVRVVVDSKINYPAACNAAETLLINRSILSTHFSTIANALAQAKVKLHCDAEALSSLSDQENPFFKPCEETDFDTEFLDLRIAVKTVGSVEEAIVHINEHGSKHTDAIITENEDTARSFMQGVDAAGVYWNASTRFADGFRYGFGAEVGVSTNKTHARGPVGLEGLVIYKYQLYGNGHIVSEFGESDQKKKYLHQKIQH